MAPEMYGENQRLFDAAIAEGKTYFNGGGLHYLKNPDGSYYGWPAGFITGPQVSDNGSPRPYQMSVFIGDSWDVRHGTLADLPDLTAWAVRTQAEILERLYREELISQQKDHEAASMPWMMP
jgi:hypothetical protein